ncbi:MAG: right-handed parallel beta-helix repeat-containing protein [Thermoguttaceae bacterium]
MKVFHFLKLNGLTRAFLFGALLMLPIGAVLSGDSAAVLSAETTGTYYVSPDGSDSNDGLSSAKAFATPEKARDAIRLRRAQGETGAFQVNLSGVFLRSEPFVLGPQDSDSSYVAKDGETSFSGGITLTDWRVATSDEKSAFPNADAEIWRAELPAVDGSPLYFEELFVGDRRAIRARFPNEGFLRPESVWEEFSMDPQTRRSDKEATPQEIRAKEGDLDPLTLSSLTASELKYSQFVIHHHWDTTRRIILGYDQDTRALKAQGAPMKSWNPWRDSSMYYLENLRTAFDAPGEWFYDGVAECVYYRPLKGETIGNTTLVAPRPGLNQLLVITGSQEEPVKNIRFENLEFCYTDAPRRVSDMKSAGISEEITGDLDKPGPSQFEPAQSAAFTVAVLDVKEASGVSFDNCKVSHIGEYGLWFQNCSDCQIVRSEFSDLGAGAVRIGGGRMDKGNKVENCVMTQGGRYFASATAVWIGQNTEDIAILHCDISDFFYTGVSVGWVWGYNGGHAFRNRIEYNRIHDIGQGAMSDMGGVYTLGTSTGTRVCNNVIYNVSSYAYGGWGLYPDEGSEGILFENNLVYDTTDGSFHQHYGKENVVRNNILARSKTNPARAGQPAHQIAITRVEDHLSTIFENNIIYWEDGVALGYNADTAQTVYAKNLWFNAGGEALFSGKSHDEWSKETGKDVDGQVADPLFVDPDSNDFRIKPGSPALEMGFVPFDYSQAGVEK